MNVTLKALVVAAVAAMSVSGAANAANYSGTNSTLTFVLMDTTARSSVVIDLGNTVGFEALDTSASAAIGEGTGVNVSGYSNVWDLSSYSSLFSNLDLTTSKWAVFTGSSNVNNGAKRIIATTAVSDASLLKNPTSTNINDKVGEMNKWLIAQNDQSSIYYPAPTGALSAKNPQTTTMFGSKGCLGGCNATLNVNWGDIDSSLSIVEYTKDASPTARLFGNEGGNTTFTFGSDFKLTLASATVSSVPEAGSLSMMMAGLGLMGLVAIRRKQQA